MSNHLTVSGVMSFYGFRASFLDYFFGTNPKNRKTEPVYPDSKAVFNMMKYGIGRAEDLFYVDSENGISACLNGFIPQLPCGQEYALGVSMSSVEEDVGQYGHGGAPELCYDVVSFFGHLRGLNETDILSVERWWKVITAVLDVDGAVLRVGSKLLAGSTKKDWDKVVELVTNHSGRHIDPVFRVEFHTTNVVDGLVSTPVCYCDNIRSYEKAAALCRNVDDARIFWAFPGLNPLAAPVYTLTPDLVEQRLNYVKYLNATHFINPKNKNE